MVGLQGDARLSVGPRWPYHTVFVSEHAHAALIRAQEIAEIHDIKFIVTRGYENQGPILRILHATARKIGAGLFFLLYPGRRAQIREIFSANGHDSGGECVDIALMYKGKMIDLLPFGVLTPAGMIARYRKMHQNVLDIAFHALTMAGFAVHANPTEALQIHCELKSHGI